MPRVLAEMVASADMVVLAVALIWEMTSALKCVDFLILQLHLGDQYLGGGGDMGEGLDSQGQYKHIVHVRGLPYRASEGEISQFFAPVETLAVRIIFGRDDR